MPAARSRALINACAQLAAGDIVIDAGSDRDEIARQLEALPGIGPWTASYVALRALGDPDVFLPTDIGVRNALRRHRCRVRSASRRQASPSPGDRGARMRCTTCGRVCNEGDRNVSHHHAWTHPSVTLRLIASDRGLRAILWGAEDAARIASIDEARSRGRPHRRARSSGRRARGVLRRNTARVRPAARSGWHAVPAVGMDDAANDSVRRRRSAMASRPGGSAIPTRPAPSGRPTARTHSASSCRAIE